MKMQEYMYMITSEAGIIPKTYKVEKVQIISRHEDLVTVSSWKCGMIIDKKINTLFKTRAAANKYIREFLNKLETEVAVQKE